jgi:hypothetical protein
MEFLEMFGDLFAEVVLPISVECLSDVLTGGTHESRCRTQTLFDVWWNAKDAT